MLQEELPDPRRDRYCGFCRRWVGAPEGALVHPDPPRFFRLLYILSAAAAGSEVGTVFMCRDCQHRRAVRRLAYLLVCGVLLAGLLLLLWLRSRPN